MPYRVKELLNECKHVSGDVSADDRGRTCLGQYLLGAELRREGVGFAAETVARFERALDAAFVELTATPLIVARDLKGQRFSDVEEMANRYAKTTSAAYVLIETAVESIEKKVSISIGGSRTTGKETGLRRHARRVADFLKRHSPKQSRPRIVVGPTAHAATSPSAASEEDVQDAGKRDALGSAVIPFGHPSAATIDCDLERPGWRKVDDLTQNQLIVEGGNAAADEVIDADAVQTDEKGEEYERVIQRLFKCFDVPSESSSAYNIVPREHRLYLGEGPTLHELRDAIQSAMPTPLMGENATAEFLPTSCGVDFVPEEELRLINEPFNDVENWKVIDANTSSVRAEKDEPMEDPALAAAEELALVEVAKKVKSRWTLNGERSCLCSGPGGTGKSHMLRQFSRYYIGKPEYVLFFINFADKTALPSERIFDKNALNRVYDESKTATENGLICFAFIDEYAQLTESDLIKLEYMSRIYMAGDERQAYKTRVYTAYKEFMLMAGGVIKSPQAIWRAENRSLSALMTYLFYGQIQPPLGQDKERSMVQMHFCPSDDRREIALRLFAHAMKLNHATILCDDVAMKKILQDLIDSHEFRFKTNLRIITSEELPGHQCWTLVLWIDEQDKPAMSLIQVFMKINLLFGRVGFRLSLICSVPRVVNRDNLFSTLLLTALSSTPVRPRLLEDERYAEFDQWLFDNTGYNVRSDRGHLVIAKDAVAFCTISITKEGESDADERLKAAARLDHRKVVFEREAMIPSSGEERWRMLAEAAGLTVLRQC